jgi:hypothetical protein
MLLVQVRRVAVGKMLASGLSAVARSFSNAARSALSYAKGVANAIDATNDLANRIGISVESLQSLQMAAKLSGVDDITGALQRAGLPSWTRSEYVEPRKLHKLHRRREVLISKGKPFIPKSSAECLKHWAPRPSRLHHHDLHKADQKAPSSFRSIAHFMRHKITWGISNIAISNLSPSALLWYICDLMEIADAHSVDVMMEYDRARMNNAIVEADTLNLTDLAGRSMPSEKAPGWLSSWLPTHDDQLLRSIVTRRLSHHKPDHPKDEGKSRKRDRSRSRSKPRGRICLKHDPRHKVICPGKSSGCKDEHLDTTQDSIYTRFKSAYQAATKKEYIAPKE